MTDSETATKAQFKPAIFGLLLALGVIGLFLPTYVIGWFAPESWAQQVAAAHADSLSERQWQAPWQSVQMEGFGAGWVRCYRLADALELDRLMDDGLLHSGNLILAEGGLIWIP